VTEAQPLDTPPPTPQTGPEEMLDAGILRSSSVMAVGTVVSRVTGVVRTTALAAALGTGILADAYTTANILPNIIYIMLLGGALNAVFIPQLVRHMKDDADEGVSYANRLLTLCALVLLAVTIVAMLLAPWISHLYAPDYTGRSLQVLTEFAYLCLPQIFFYGMYTLYSQVLNARGRFAAPMFAPVANNLVVIAGCVIFIAVVKDPNILTISDHAILLLGAVTTAGIIVQAAVLTPVLARTGFHFRPRFDLRGQGLGTAVRLARWTIFFVVMNQLGFLVIMRWATSANYTSTTSGIPGGGSFVYNNAYLMFILPHSIVTVSVVTALMPRMSRAAHAGNMTALRRDISRGMRLVSAAIVPSSIVLLLLGPQLALLLLGYGNTTADGARLIGTVLQAFAVGAVGFSLYYVLLRGFYALEDTKTPALVSIGLNALNLAVSYALYRRLPQDKAVVGLALGYSIAFSVVMIVFWILLRPRTGGLDTFVTVRTLVRLLLAGAVAGVVGWAVQDGIGRWLGQGKPASLIAVAVVVPSVFMLFALVARRLRVAEVRDVLEMIGSKLRLRPRGAA